MRGRAPWNSLDADHSSIADNIHQSFIHKTPQPEIDICLECTDMVCNGNECKRIKQCRHEAFIQRKEKYKREFPPGFKEDAFAGVRNVDLAAKYKLTKYMVDAFAGVRNVDLAAKYKLTKYMVDILKKDLGIKPKAMSQDLEQFKKDALAGMSQNALSAKHHMSKERVRKLFKEYGIDRTKKEYKNGY